MDHGGGGGQIYLRVLNVMWIDLDPLAFILNFLKQFGLWLGWFAVSVKQSLDHCPWLVLQPYW
jgi:hypothetical protein